MFSDVVSLIKQSEQKVGKQRHHNGGDSKEATTISPRIQQQVNHSASSTQNRLNGSINSDLFSLDEEGKQDEAEQSHREEITSPRRSASLPQQAHNQRKRLHAMVESPQRDSSLSSSPVPSLSRHHLHTNIASPTRSRLDHRKGTHTSQELPSRRNGSLETIDTSHEHLSPLSSPTSNYSPYSARSQRRKTSMDYMHRNVTTQDSEASPSHKSYSQDAPSSVQNSSHSLSSTMSRNEELIHHPERHAQRRTRVEEIKFLKQFNQRLQDDISDLKEKHKLELQVLKQKLQAEKDKFLREQNLSTQQKIQTKFEELKKNHEQGLMSQIDDKFKDMKERQKQMQHENKSLSTRISNLLGDLQESRSEYRALNMKNQKLEKENSHLNSENKSLQTKVQFLKSKLNALGGSVNAPASSDVGDAFQSQQHSLGSSLKQRLTPRELKHSQPDTSIPTPEKPPIPSKTEFSPHLDSITTATSTYMNITTTGVQQETNKYTDAVESMEQLLQGKSPVELSSVALSDIESDAEPEDRHTEQPSYESDDEWHQFVALSSDDSATDSTTDLIVNHEEEEEITPDSLEISRLRKRKRKIVREIDAREQQLYDGSKSINGQFSSLSGYLQNLVQQAMHIVKGHKCQQDRIKILESIVSKLELENEHLCKKYNAAMHQDDPSTSSSATKRTEMHQNTDNADQVALLDEMELLRDAYDNLQQQHEEAFSDYRKTYEVKLRRLEAQLEEYKQTFGIIAPSSTPVLTVDLSSSNTPRKQKPRPEASPKQHSQPTSPSPTNTNKISHVPRQYRYWRRTDRLCSPTSLMKRFTNEKFEFICQGTEEIIVQSGFCWNSLERMSRNRFAGELYIGGKGITVFVKRTSSNNSTYEKIMYFGDKQFCFYPFAFKEDVQMKMMKGRTAEHPFNFQQKGLCQFSMSSERNTPPIIPQLVDRDTKLEVADRKCLYESALTPNQERVIHHFSVILSPSIHFTLCLHVKDLKNSSNSNSGPLRLLSRIPIHSSKNSSILRSVYPKMLGAWSHFRHKRLFSPREFDSMKTGSTHIIHLELSDCHSCQLCFVSEDKAEKWIDLKMVGSMHDGAIKEWRGTFESDLCGVLNLMCEEESNRGVYAKTLEFPIVE